MPQFLIREFTDSTGHIHTSVEKTRKNETLSIVEAESKEDAFYKYKLNKDLRKLSQTVRNFRKRLDN
ncbi:DUF1381 domain-containing protein [Staphylococcus capitis]|uniref:DUF1381 domain-containing protein n=1 Tax=Staphylococcus capitis TaxID=29388 RepID=UPI003CFBC9B8